MLAPGNEEVLSYLPEAVCRVDAACTVRWVESGFEAKLGLPLGVGQSLFELFERGPFRDGLERSMSASQPFKGPAITRALHQVRVRTQPCGTPHAGESWVIVEPNGMDDELAFARAIQEIARAVGEILEVDAVCAAAVMSMVRCAQVSRAEVYLVEGRSGLKRVAVSDVAGSGSGSGAASRERATWMDATLKQALASGEPQVGVSRGTALPSIFAAIPLMSQRRTLGLLVLHKVPGAAFGQREMDLWSAAGAQLSVAVENARLLREAQAALRSRDEFMSIASHELKTPLTPLKMSLYTMEKKIALGQPVALSSVLKSKRQVDRLANLVSDLLDASRVELGKLAVNRLPLDVSQLVVEVVEQFRGAFDRELCVEVPSARVWVMGDRDRLEQVLVNLLENAQKYSPAEEPVTVLLEQGEDSVSLRVQDHGIGIPLEDQDKIFQRFHRAQNVSHRNFAGLGLGLFISESVMRLHEGSLSVTSSVGMGSTFFARMPSMPAEEVARLPRRALLLEEDSLEEARAAALLADAGFEVHGKDSQECLRNLASAPLDLVVISATLGKYPREHFLQTLTALTLARSIPLVFAGAQLPAWATSEDAVLCEKPYSVADLGASLKRAQETGRLASVTDVLPAAAAEGHLYAADGEGLDAQAGLDDEVDLLDRPWPHVTSH